MICNLRFNCGLFVSLKNGNVINSNALPVTKKFAAIYAPTLTTCLFARRHYGKFPVLLRMSSSVALLDIGNDFCAKK